MARPRIIRLKQGELVLRNVDAAEAERIARFLKQTVEDDAAVVEAPTPAALTDNACGISKVGKDWCVVHVKYDPHTKAAQVIDVKVAGPDRYFAEQQFKIDVDNIGII